MCGIVGYIGEEQAAPILLDGLSKLEYRGYDSAGIAVYNNGEIKAAKAMGRLKVLDALTQGGHLLPGRAGIGHTRWATHGVPSNTNAHPHFNKDESIAVVHNGIIENYLELRSRLEKHGYVFQSETDTETVAHLVDYLHTGKHEDLAMTVLKAVTMLRGSYALGVVSMDDPNEIVAARRDNPLVIGLGEGENMIASDITAIISRTRKYIILDDGEVAIVRPDQVTVMNAFGDVVEKEVQEVNWDLSAAEKGGYEHFMMKEMMEQPQAVSNTIHPRIQEGRIVFEDEGLTDERLKKAKNIHIIGCGSALHAGMVGRSVIEKLSHVRCNTWIASEFRYENPIIDADDLCIIISQS